MKKDITKDETVIIKAKVGVECTCDVCNRRIYRVEKSAIDHAEYWDIKLVNAKKKDPEKEYQVCSDECLTEFIKHFKENCNRDQSMIIKKENINTILF